MTHHPDTPSSRNEGEPCKRCHGKGVVEDGQLTHSAGGILYACGPIQCVKDCPDCNGVGKILASHTEQAAPSVASGVESKTAVLNDLKDWLEGLVEANFTGHVPQGVFSEANEYIERIEALAAPGAAIAAREQAIVAPELVAGSATADAYRKAGLPRDVRDTYIGLLESALASRQEAPAASAEEWMPVTPEQHSKAFAAGDLMALAEEAGGARMAENVVQVTRSDIERIIYFAKDREDTAARSPATVAQPVEEERQRLRGQQSDAVMPQIGPLLDAWEGTDNDTKGLIREHAPGLARHIAGINRAMESGSARWNAVVKLAHDLDDAAQHITEQRAYEFATKFRVLAGVDGDEAADEAAQLCPSQGCGGEAKAREANSPLTAWAIELLVAAGHVSREKADEAYRIACETFARERAALSGLEHVGKESE